MLLLPSLASCRLLSAGVNLENDVALMSRDEGPHIELPSGMESNDETRLLTHTPDLIRQDLLEVLPIKHSRLDCCGSHADPIYMSEHLQGFTSVYEHTD